MHNQRIITAPTAYATTLLISCLCMLSCIKEVDFDSVEDCPAVVECILEKKPVQTLKLYRMMSLSDSNFIPIEDASVYLMKQTGNRDDFVAKFEKTRDGIWEAEYEPDFGAIYSLQIIVEGKDTLRASTRFPDDLKVISYTKIIRDGEHRFQSPSDSIEFVCKTCEVHYGSYSKPFTGASGRFYSSFYGDGSFKAYTRSYDDACKMWIYPHKDVTTPIVAGSLDYLYEEYYTFSGTEQPYASYAITDHPGADNFNINSGQLSDLNFELTDEAKSFLLYSNDIVCKYQLFHQWYSFMCPPLALHDHFVRIEHPAHFTNGLNTEELKHSYHHSDHSFFITADYTDTYPSYRFSFGNMFVPDLFNGFVNEVRFLSDEYDAFLRDVVSKSLNQDNFVLSEYDHHNIYSNIEGGFGIFGAQHITWEEPCLTY